MNKRGFTLIELIMIIVIIGILAVIAIPRYFSLQAQAQQAAEDGVVGAVRSGIYMWHANNMATTGLDAYPASLEAVPPAAGVAFDEVIENGIAIAAQGGAGQWSDETVAGAAFTYIGPTTTVYTYTPADGSFK